jgi:membrane protein YqaA with SNARE-associated domain
MAVLLGALSFREGRIFLIPPFAATLTMLVHQPGVAIAQPVVVVCGSVFGTMIGTVLALLLGFGPKWQRWRRSLRRSCFPCCERFIRQGSLWRCALRCCTSGHGLRLRSCCHSRWSR